MFILSSVYKKIARYLNLSKPLVIFDVETTGINFSSDRIVAIAYIKIFPSGMVKKEELFFNPEIRISPESISIHGIRNRDVKDKPVFKEKAQELFEIFNDSFYAGFNVLNFDLEFLRREFLRVGTDLEFSPDQVIDSKEIFRYMVPRSLSSTYQYYAGREYRESSSALADTEAAAEILLKQLEKYQEIRDISFIKNINSRDEAKFIDTARKFYWRNGEAIFAFSKHKGKVLSQVVKEDPQFCAWLLGADFSEETKAVVRKAMEKVG